MALSGRSGLSSELGLLDDDFVLGFEGGILKNLLLAAALEHLEVLILDADILLPGAHVGGFLPLAVMDPNPRVRLVRDRESPFGPRADLHFLFPLLSSQS